MRMITAVFLAVLHALCKAESVFHSPETPLLLRQPLDHSYQYSSNQQTELPPFSAGSFTIRQQQDGQVCKSYGEQQWTGTIDVSNDKQLFYWFFESRNDAKTDPIVVWLNGGPGASSMLGLFSELGPCNLTPTSPTTSTPNPFAWNNNASLLFIDQPAGVGFSTVKPGRAVPSTDLEAAQDLQTFLQLFFTKVFPNRAHLPIHLAGESYAGHWLPVTVKHILESRTNKSPDAFQGNISSLVFVNSIFDRMQISRGHYELFCTTNNSQGQSPLWNSTVCRNLAYGLPQVESLALACDVNYNGKSCKALDTAAFPLSLGVLFDEMATGKRSHYNVDQPCHDPPRCSPTTTGNFTEYLNRPNVLQALGYPADFQYRRSNPGRFAESDDPYMPTTRELASILDWSINNHDIADPTPIRVLVINGNRDGLVSTPGQKWLFDKLSWTGAAGYRAAQWRNWNELGLSCGGSGDWKRSEDGRLVFVSVDDAGHMVPLDQPEVADGIISKWIRRELY